MSLFSKKEPDSEKEKKLAEVTQLHAEFEALDDKYGKTITKVRATLQLKNINNVDLENLKQEIAEQKKELEDIMGRANENQFSKYWGVRREVGRTTSAMLKTEKRLERALKDIEQHQLQPF